MHHNEQVFLDDFTCNLDRWLQNPRGPRREEETFATSNVPWQGHSYLPGDALGARGTFISLLQWYLGGSKWSCSKRLEQTSSAIGSCWIKRLVLATLNLLTGLHDLLLISAMWRSTVYWKDT